MTTTIPIDIEMKQTLDNRILLKTRFKIYYKYIQSTRPSTRYRSFTEHENAPGLEQDLRISFDEDIDNKTFLYLSNILFIYFNIRKDKNTIEENTIKENTIKKFFSINIEPNLTFEQIKSTLRDYSRYNEIIKQLRNIFGVKEFDAFMPDYHQILNNYRVTPEDPKNIIHIISVNNNAEQKIGEMIINYINNGEKIYHYQTDADEYSKQKNINIIELYALHHTLSLICRLNNKHITKFFHLKQSIIYLYYLDKFLNIIQNSVETFIEKLVIDEPRFIHSYEDEVSYIETYNGDKKKKYMNVNIYLAKNIVSIEDNAIISCFGSDAENFIITIYYKIGQIFNCKHYDIAQLFEIFQQAFDDKNDAYALNTISDIYGKHSYDEIRHLYNIIYKYYPYYYTVDSMEDNMDSLKSNFIVYAFVNYGNYNYIINKEIPDNEEDSILFLIRIYFKNNYVDEIFGENFICIIDTSITKKIYSNVMNKNKSSEIYQFEDLYYNLRDIFNNFQITIKNRTLERYKKIKQIINILAKETTLNEQRYIELCEYITPETMDYYADYYA